MGMGDVLMSVGEAKRAHQRTGQPILITDQVGRPVRSDLFDGVPYLTQRPLRGIRFQRLVNCPGHRPYIKAKSPTHWTWRDYQPEPADIVFTPAELAFAAPYRGCIMLEPNVKEIGHRNKDWGFERWRALAKILDADGVGPLLQCFRPGDRLLGVERQAMTTSFRQTLAVLSVCRAYVGPEGGLHHGAAAVRVPAVVIMGGFISPRQTGYASHRNLFTGGEPCGSRVDCAHCRAAMLAITPEMVAAELKGLL